MIRLRPWALASGLVCSVMIAVTDDAFEGERPVAGFAVVDLQPDVGLELETDPVVTLDEIDLSAGLGRVDVQAPHRSKPKETGTT